MMLPINLFHRLFRTVYNSKIVRCSLKRNLSFSSRTCLLGIETSCDDTGCAVINGDGKILGEALCSQTKLHVKYGGVNPIIARDLHRDNIENSVNEALRRAAITMDHIEAIAVTVKPGLVASLEIGVKYAKYLSKKHNKPLIPIHHMEAHALVVRMFHNVTFPFLSLLISGGHCLLVVVKDVEQFLLLGNTIDISPGQVLDKAARRMKLKNIKALSGLAGGKAIEKAALNASGQAMFQFPLPLIRQRDCNFSFSGLREAFLQHLAQKEREHNIVGDQIIPEVSDLCAAFQTAVTEHILNRTERAIMFCQKHNILNSENRNIVVSGGVACNNFIFKCIESLCSKYNCVTFRPPPRYCTDNGVMIAWNGIEKLCNNCDLNVPICIDPSAALGKNIIHEVQASNLKCTITRVKKLNFI